MPDLGESAKSDASVTEFTMLLTAGGRETRHSVKSKKSARSLSICATALLGACSGPDTGIDDAVGARRGVCL